MYLLIACAGSWLLLLGSFFTVCAQLPQPWTTADLVILAVVGTAALLFARLGLVSLLALLLRILPTGRLRSRLADLVVRAMPRLLAASVLTIVSTGLVVQSAHATPLSASGPEPTSAAKTAEAPLDPGWPTSDSGDPSIPAVDDGDPSGRRVDDGPLPDPRWPTEPPADSAPSSPPVDPEEDPPDDPPHDETAEPPNRPETSTYIVAPGDSLWSIAAEHAEEHSDIPQLVAVLFTTNEDVIGPDPSLILAGQRLEIQP